MNDCIWRHQSTFPVVSIFLFFGKQFKKVQRETNIVHQKLVLKHIHHEIGKAHNQCALRESKFYELPALFLKQHKIKTLLIDSICY